MLNEPELAMGKGTHWVVVITQRAGLKKITGSDKTYTLYWIVLLEINLKEILA